MSEKKPFYLHFHSQRQGEAVYICNETEAKGAFKCIEYSAYEKLHYRYDRYRETAKAMASERDRFRAALREMEEHLCDGGGERPCSQMWYQDVIDETLK